jgi:hypothetical protein
LFTSCLITAGFVRRSAGSFGTEEHAQWSTEATGDQSEGLLGMGNAWHCSGLQLCLKGLVDQLFFFARIDEWLSLLSQSVLDVAFTPNSLEGEVCRDCGGGGRGRPHDSTGLATI